MEWIKTSEKYPPKGVAVLVCLNIGLITMAYIKEDNEREFIWQLFGDIENIAELGRSWITHWMPLPELPK